MDKNTIIGFILIGVVLVAFSWFNRPTPEQLEAQRRYQDSIAMVENQRQMEIKKEEDRKLQELQAYENLPDSAKTAHLRQNYGNFAEAMIGTDG